MMAKKGMARPVEDEEKGTEKAAERSPRPVKAAEGGLRIRVVVAYLRDLGEEVKKVAWPSWVDARRASLAVGVIVFYSMVILMTVDLLTTVVFRRFLPGG